MEEFKPFDELLQPDERWQHFVFQNSRTGNKEQSSLRARYDVIASIELHSLVPEDIQSQYVTAKMLCVYAWLYYPFHQSAEQKAFSTLEMALAQKYPAAKKDGLKKLLIRAISQGVISDQGFSHIQLNADDPMKYTRMLPEIIPSLRNAIAHGEPILHPNSVFTVRNCAEIINQLYAQST